MGARVAAVVFDNDGLLLDTEPAWMWAEREVCARQGVTLTDQQQRMMRGSSPKTGALMFEQILGQPGRGAALVQELYTLATEKAAESVSPRPGALELLEAITAAGLPAGVASNASRPFLETVLDGAGLLAGGPFAAVVSASEVEHPKPAPDLYLRCCALLGAEPGACAGLEDSVPGAAAAKAAGLFTIGVPYLPDGPLPDADLVVPSLADPRVYAALGIDAL